MSGPKCWNGFSHVIDLGGGHVRVEPHTCKFAHNVQDSRGEYICTRCSRPEIKPPTDQPVSGCFTAGGI